MKMRQRSSATSCLNGAIMPPVNRSARARARESPSSSTLPALPLYVRRGKLCALLVSVARTDTARCACSSRRCTIRTATRCCA